MAKTGYRPTLSIGIPTYNRPDALERRMFEIERFPDVINELVVCDNSDNENEALRSRGSIGRTKIRYVKNPVNIGGGANFIRVVEHAATDYMWWRGDDDVISENQVHAVIEGIETKAELILISNELHAPFHGKGVDEFVDNFEKVQTMGWLSSIVLPVDLAKEALPWGYAGIASGWANVALVLGLFRVKPEMRFIVMPFHLGGNEFRDVGREGLRWAFFNTCIRQFPMTANLLATNDLRRRYLYHWRRSRRFRLLKSMARIKLGYSVQEKLSLSTFLPIASWHVPKSIAIFVLLYAMSKLPRIVYQISFSLIWVLLAPGTKMGLGLDFIPIDAHMFEAFRLLRSSQKSASSEAFM